MFWLLDAIFRLNIKECVYMYTHSSEVYIYIYFNAIKWTKLEITIYLLYTSLHKHYIILNFTIYN